MSSATEELPDQHVPTQQTLCPVEQSEIGMKHSDVSHPSTLHEGTVVESPKKEQEEEWNNFVPFVLYVLSAIVFLFIGLFVYWFNRAELKYLGVSDSSLNVFTEKWGNDDIYCMFSYNIMVWYAAGIGGLGGIGCIIGLFSCLPFSIGAKKGFHYTGFVIAFIAFFIALGVGIWWTVMAYHGELAWGQGWTNVPNDSQSCFEAIAGDRDFVDKGITPPTTLSSYCDVTQQPQLYRAWPEECPQMYQPATDQLEAYLAGNVPGAEDAQNNPAKAREYMNDYDRCVSTGVCDGCLEVGARCKAAVNQGMLYAQKWDGYYLWISGVSGMVWCLVLVWFVYKKKPVEPPAEKSLSAISEGFEDASEPAQSDMSRPVTYA